MIAAIVLLLIGLGYFIHNEIEQKRIANIGIVEEQPLQENTDAPARQLLGFEIQPVCTL